MNPGEWLRKRGSGSQMVGSRRKKTGARSMVQISGSWKDDAGFRVPGPRQMEGEYDKGT